jgi:hypothetical protein
MNPPAAAVFERWRFLTLTLLICAWLLLAPTLTADWRVQLLLEGFMAVTVLFTIWANPRWRALRNWLIVLWLLSLTGTLLSILTADTAWRWSRTLELMTLVPLMGLLAAGILAFVLRERTLTVDSIFATIAAFLMVAIMYAQIYLCLVAWRPDSFSMPVEIASRPLHLLNADFTYFSLVTLATVGYGDILPATPTARMLAMFEAVSGLFYIAIVVAIFVGKYAAQRRG